MSHFIKIDLKIKVSELSNLDAALTTLNWNLMQNATPRTYAGYSKPFKFVAVNPDKSRDGFDIGLEQVNDEFHFHTDYFGGSVERTLGKDLSLLKQEFAAEVIRDQYYGAQISESMENGVRILEVMV